MLSVHGIYDGKSIKINEKINEKKKFKESTILEGGLKKPL